MNSHDEVSVLYLIKWCWAWTTGAVAVTVGAIRWGSWHYKDRAALRSDAIRAIVKDEIKSTIQPQLDHIQKGMEEVREMMWEQRRNDKT